MGLHIIIGFAGQESSATAFPVYVGRSGTEAEEAMKTSAAVRFERLSNVTGVRKNNPHRLADGVHVDDENVWDEAKKKRRGAIRAAELKRVRLDLEGRVRVAKAAADAAGQVLLDATAKAVSLLSAVDAAAKAAAAAPEDAVLKAAAEAAATEAKVATDAETAAKAAADEMAKALEEAQANLKKAPAAK